MSDLILSEKFDDVDYYWHGCSEAGLPSEQAAVHIGMFLSWIIDRGMSSEFFTDSIGVLLDYYKQGRLTASEILNASAGGLLGDMMSDECAAFCHDYYDRYLSEYVATVAAGNGGYEAKDSAENKQKIAALLDARFAEWQKTAGYKAPHITEVGLESVLQQVAQKCHYSYSECQAAYEAAVDIIAGELAANRRVTVEGFGTIERRQLGTRAFTAKSTGEAVPATSDLYIGFTAAVVFKKAVDVPPVGMQS